jgi:nitrogen PTS system EIIA component
MIDVASLIERGGVFFNVRGESPESVIKELITTARLPEKLDKEALLKAIIERESLMPTAIGYGIAIPHPRNPMMADSSEERIIVGYSREGIDYRALDKKPVFALFIILSSSQKDHLQILSQLSFLFHDKEFRKTLETRPSKEELCAVTRSIRKGWD